MSVGVSASPPSSFDYDRVFDAADRALYAAKAAGRNCVCVAGHPHMILPPPDKSPTRQTEAALPS